MTATRIICLFSCVAALSALFGCGSSTTTTIIPPPKSGFSKSSLKGSYAFEAIGVDTFGPYQVGGVLVADGNGTITGGEQTYDNVPDVVQDEFTGSYTINSDGKGTITLNTGDISIGVNGTETLGVVLVSTSKALITQFDTSATSSGDMDLQTAVAMPTGGYAFVVQGVDVAFNFPLGFGGVFNIDNSPSVGDISGPGSVSDEDFAGTLSLNQGLFGSVSTPDSFGRVFITLLASFAGGIVFDGYIVDATHIKLIEDDSFGVTGGIALGQGSATGSFTSNSAFSGNFVFGTFGQNIAGFGAEAGLFTADGAGNLTNGLTDLNFGGFVVSDTLTGTYSVDSSGTGRAPSATAFGVNGAGPSLIFYLTGAGNPALVLQADDFALATGAAYTQASGTLSFDGNYGVGFTAIDTSTFAESDGTAQISAKATAGTFSGTADINEAFVPTPNQSFSGTYTSNTNGRFTGTVSVNSSTPGTSAFYLVNSAQGFVVGTESDTVDLGVFLQQITP